MIAFSNAFQSHNPYNCLETIEVKYWKRAHIFRKEHDFTFVMRRLHQCGPSPSAFKLKIIQKGGQKNEFDEHDMFG
jgi:hypothetical protein